MIELDTVSFKNDRLIFLTELVYLLPLLDSDSFGCWLFFWEELVLYTIIIDFHTVLLVGLWVINPTGWFWVSRSFVCLSSSTTFYLEVKLVVRILQFVEPSLFMGKLEVYGLKINSLNLKFIELPCEENTICKIRTL